MKKRKQIHDIMLSKYTNSLDRGFHDSITPKFYNYLRDVLIHGAVSLYTKIYVTIKKPYEEEI